MKTGTRLSMRRLFVRITLTTIPTAFFFFHGAGAESDRFLYAFAAINYSYSLINSVLMDRYFLEDRHTNTVDLFLPVTATLLLFGYFHKASFYTLPEQFYLSLLAGAGMIATQLTELSWLERAANKTGPWKGFFLYNCRLFALPFFDSSAITLFSVISLIDLLSAFFILWITPFRVRTSLSPAHNRNIGLYIAASIFPLIVRNLLVGSGPGTIATYDMLERFYGIVSGVALIFISSRSYTAIKRAREICTAVPRDWIKPEFLSALAIGLTCLFAFILLSTQMPLPIQDGLWLSVCIGVLGFLYSLTTGLSRNLSVPAETALVFWIANGIACYLIGHVLIAQSHLVGAFATAAFFYGTGATFYLRWMRQSQA